jgi:formylglycine-generating enzyme required for sulfatase activity
LKGVFIENRNVTLSAFKIAKYETTYELWYEVYQWADSHGYSFANAGREGHDGNDGEAPITESEPVTAINWRDAVIWCNAYSEMSGKEPVYYTEGTYTTVLRTSTNDSGTNTAADGVKMKTSANGYRLPTDAEWEYAARGGVPSASAFANRWAGTNDGGSLGAYAWYKSNSDSATHRAGEKKASAAGLHDMSGNVWEWCWDWYGAISTNTEPATDPVGSSLGTYRVIRGGSWGHDASDCAVAYRYGKNPHIRRDDLGFRVVLAN